MSKMTITTCNICGKKFDKYDEATGVRIYRKLGYGSKYDGEQIELDICCNCLDKLIDSCKTSPVETNKKCEHRIEF